jgi:hypothetical protein
MALAVLLACGVIAVGGAAVLWARGTYRATVGNWHDYTYLRFQASGDPYLHKIAWKQQYITTTDLDGNPIVVSAQADAPYPADLRHAWPWAGREPMPWSSRIAGLQDGQRPPNFWYLIHDGLADGHAYLEGYSKQTKRRIGYIGTAGFRETPVPPAEQFPMRAGLLWSTDQVESAYGVGDLATEPTSFLEPAGPDGLQPWLVFLNNMTHVAEIDLNSHQVRDVLSHTATPVRSICLGRTGRGHNWLAMRTDDTIYIHMPDGEQIVFPLAPELQGHDLQILRRPDGDFTVVSSARIDSADSMKHFLVYIAAADGKLGEPKDVATTYNLPATFSYEAPLVLGAPALLAGCLLTIRPHELLELEMADSWDEAVALAFRQYGLYLAITVAAGLALAVVCYRRQTHYQLSRAERIGWPLFVFLFGVPGWIGYRYCRRWPPLDVCPACHELAPHDQEICAVCGREFPLPESKGTEIFA